MDKILTVIVAVILSIGAAFGVSTAAQHATNADGGPTAGALAGPDIASPYLKWGGVAEFNSAQKMNTGTTTLCSIQNPYAGTSTLQSFAIQVNTGTSTSALIDLATSTDRVSTTTPTTLLQGQSVPANSRATFSYSPTSNTNIVKPGEFVLAKIQQTLSGGYTYNGNCTATFQAVQNF